MSSFLRIFLSCGVAALMSFMITPARANVMLTFKVNNVSHETCSGLFQPTCSTVGAAGFDETVVFGGIATAARSDSISGALMQSAASFGFPLSMSGSPYTSMLRASVSGRTTSAQNFTQLDNSFDGVAGTASAGIFSDLISDTTNDLGMRTQQEYQLGYNLLGRFGDLMSYTDLVSQSIDAFFSKYIGGTMAGSFSESGAHSTLDPVGLHFTDYAFSQYLGDVTLIAVQPVDPPTVPEPGSLALVLAAAAGMLCARRRRSRASATSLR